MIVKLCSYFQYEEENNNNNKRFYCIIGHVHNFISFPENVLSGSATPDKEDPFPVQIIQTSSWLPALFG